MSELKQKSLFEQKRKIEIKECNSDLIDNLIAKHHYSKKVTKNRWKSFVVYYNGILEGGMQIGYGIRPELKDHIIKGANSKNVKEFDRMYLSDVMPKNSESKTIGYLLRYLKKNYSELKVLISYADGIRGKKGTIYQASNFYYLGIVKGEFYYLPNKNEWVHPVSMYHRHKTRAWESIKKIYPEIQHIKGDQHRYIYFLDKKWKDKLLLPILPYPKNNAVVV